MFIYILIILLIGIFPIKWIYKYFKNPINSLPGPRLYEISIMDFTRNPSELILEWFNKFGDTFCWKLVAYKSVLVTINPKIVKLVLTSKCRKINKMDVGLQYITGSHGLLANEENEHNNQRYLLQSKFTKNSINELILDYQIIINKLINKWNKKINESETNNINVDIKYEFTKLTLEVLCELLLDYSINSIENDLLSEKLYKNLCDYLNVFNKYNLLGYQYIGKYIRYIPNSTNFKYWKSRIKLIKIINDIIENNKNNKNKLINIFNNENMSDIEIFDNILTIFLAGHETTASTLSWILFEICKNPYYQEKMKDDNKYIDYVIKETLRLHPPVPIIGRKTIKKIKVNNYFTIPKNTDIIISPLASHTNSEYWENPLEFIPERWDNLKINPYIYMPFLSGPRGCLGKHFALKEIELVLKRLLIEFKFSSNNLNLVKNKIDFTCKPDNLIVNITK